MVAASGLLLAMVLHFRLLLLLHACPLPSPPWTLSPFYPFSRVRLLPSACSPLMLAPLGGGIAQPMASSRCLPRYVLHGAWAQVVFIT